MSIAISLKVNDGVVLASDSAATLLAETPEGTKGVFQVYNNANKIVNLYKGLPIGAITWGSAGIGSASMSRLLKDFRERISGRNPEYSDWALNPSSYKVENVARTLKKFLREEHYEPAYGEQEQKPSLGFLLAGYSHGGGLAEEYEVTVSNTGQWNGPKSVRSKDSVGVTWRAEGEAVHRMLLGFSPQLKEVLTENLSVPEDQVQPTINVLRQRLTAQMVSPPMPIQDAIDLAEFLVDVTVKYSRFTPGAPTVGGPIEIAAITKHEGFKWVERKHYYRQELNPEVSIPTLNDQSKS